MRLPKQSALPLALVAVFGCSALAAQGAPRQPDMMLDAKTRNAVIDGVLAQLNQAYVFPDRAAEMERGIRDRVRKREYDRITSAAEFADSLTSHLQAVSRDKHLRVRYSNAVLPVIRQGSEPPPEVRERQRAQMRMTNFGFEKVERLPGNVGYLELRGFSGAEEAQATATAAMNFLANTDALIVDLRRNGGGSPEMVRFLSSYLFGSKPVHLNSLYWRPGNRTDEFWTLAEIPGKRFGENKPVYVLTSNRTFSGAEEFSYNLQNLKRATIVGETTGGGAHPGGPRRVNDHFEVWVPSGRAINPITKTNWEGTGVKPDVAVPAPQALKTAHVAALRSLLEGTTDPQWKNQLQQLIRDLETGTTQS